jgi:SpoIIAA-like
LKITVPEKLNADDFPQIAPQIDSVIRQYGKIRLLIDACRFEGWENSAALESRTKFVERVAVVVGPKWQHWVIGLIRLFLHPEVEAFDKSDENEALRWIVG